MLTHIITQSGVGQTLITSKYIRPIPAEPKYESKVIKYKTYKKKTILSVLIISSTTLQVNITLFAVTTLDMPDVILTL